MKHSIDFALTTYCRFPFQMKGLEFQKKNKSTFLTDTLEPKMLC